MDKELGSPREVHELSCSSNLDFFELSCLASEPRFFPIFSGRLLRPLIAQKLSSSQNSKVDNGPKFMHKVVSGKAQEMAAESCGGR